MAIDGTELLEVQGIAQNDLPSGQTKSTTTQAIANLAFMAKTGGSFTLTGTTAVTVNNTTIATTDVVVISLGTVGGTVGAFPTLKTITSATGFTVAGTAGDTSIYNYAIITPILS